jgi:hypothetical protein
VLAEGVQVAITGDEVEGDGQRWFPVRTADGEEGYVPVLYTSRAEPDAAPAQQGPPR